MQPDFQLFLVGLVALYQFADVTSTNKALALGAGTEANGFIAKLMQTFGRWWWVIKPIVLAFALWRVWDNPLGFYVVVVAACGFYHWVVFGNNLPTIARWRKRRAGK